jgi:hypothetical protein
MFKIIVMHIIGAISALSIGLLISHNTHASENRISISLASYHITTDYKPYNIYTYNQSNSGLAIEHKISDNIYIEMGLYNNSIYKTSGHMGIILNKKYKGIEYGVNIGVVTGYAWNIAPFAKSYIQYKHIRFGYIPKIDIVRVDSVITFEYIIDL